MILTTGRIGEEATGGSGGLTKEEVKPRKKGGWTEDRFFSFDFIYYWFNLFIIGNKSN